MDFGEYQARQQAREQERYDRERTASQQRVETDKQRFNYSRNRPNTSIEDIMSGKTGVKSKALGVGFGIGMGIDTIMNMREGDDFGTAAVKGAFSGMLYATMPTLMVTKDMASLGVAGFAGAYKWQREKKQWWNQQFSPNFGGQYQDTRRAQTMRQAAVEAIQGSKLNARSALGGEAKIFSQNFNRG